MAKARTLSPQDLERLLQDFGRESHLADRIATLRQHRGWSQDRLAAEMAGAGVPIPQSAISKIEKPASGGRRAITLDEAIAFAKVFGVPLLELVLPNGATEAVEVMRGLADGPKALKQAEQARQDYESMLDRLAGLMEADQSNRLLVADAYEAALEKYGPDDGDSFTLSFFSQLSTRYESRRGDAS